jgi:hypothetical protein
LVAAIVATSGGRGEDFTVTTSGPELLRPALVPVIAGTVLGLRITSTSRTGSAVSVETFTRRGRSLGRHRVAVTGRAVTGWTLRDPAGRAAYLVVTTEGSSAGVYALAHYSGRAGIAALALRPATFTVVRPAVAATVTTP